MDTNDLREWLEEVNKLGELQRIEKADWELEIGCISHLNTKRQDSPALLFDHIKGYPPGYRLVTCSLRSPRRVALTLNLPDCTSTHELLAALQRKLTQWESNLSLFPPKKVKTGSAMENVSSGSEVDLFKFPSPKWNELDGGRYIGTGDAVITRDPDTGETNLGSYRVMVHDKNTVGLYISPGHHGRIHYEKYHAQGKPCPVVISLGHDPAVFCISCVEVPSGAEYNYIGAIKGRPVEVVEEELTGLPFPASSELVLAGWCPPGETKMEGPFGEWTGYYASGERLAPIVKIERIYHRNSPIVLGTAMGRPPCDTAYYTSVMRSARVYCDLVKMGVPDVKLVWMNEVGGRLLFIVAIKQRYAGHAKQAALAVAQGSRASAYMGRYVIVVDEDIDPTNMDDVIWALCTRSDPEKDIDIVRRAWSSPLDPMIRKPTNAFFNSRAIIDACKPFEWIDEFPQDISFSPELEKRVKEKWNNLF
ncbi:MAG: UbiD family decarboxylase [Chloroflexi bacterium]|nr:UbiD family decarboxylase [Chloroflexota bacterium]